MDKLFVYPAFIDPCGCSTNESQYCQDTKIMILIEHHPKFLDPTTEMILWKNVKQQETRPLNAPKSNYIH